MMREVINRILAYEVLTLGEVADMLGISRENAKKRVQRKLLPPYFKV